ncbi:TetR/AcrR family transcriptional regulator, partial [Streptomyces sp. NPDC096068]
RPAPHPAAAAGARGAWTASVGDPRGAPRPPGELVADLDAEQLAFEVIALMEAANAHSVLFGGPGAYDRAERGIAARLRASVTDRGREALAAA